MNLEQIETIIAKNLTITDQRLMDGVIGAVLDAVAAEREECAQACEAMNAKCDFAGPAVFARVIRARGNNGT